MQKYENNLIKEHISRTCTHSHALYINEQETGKTAEIALFFKKIWSIQKKAVPLHPISGVVQTNPDEKRQRFEKDRRNGEALYLRSKSISRAHFNEAQMAESVDALVSNTSGAIRAGSTPALGTEIGSFGSQFFTRKKYKHNKGQAQDLNTGYYPKCVNHTSGSREGGVNA